VVRHPLVKKIIRAYEDFTNNVSERKKSRPDEIAESLPEKV
jgi:phosphate starvation-inducible protein PhoH